MNVRLCGAIALVLLGTVIRSDATELGMLCAIAMQTAVVDLQPQFERATGHKLTVMFDNLGGLVKRVQSGETADVIVIPEPGAEAIVASGKVGRAELTAVAQARIGLAVRKGASRPDISSAEAVRRTLLAARSITYSDPAMGGATPMQIVQMLERMGIAGEMKPKTVFPRQPFTGFGAEVTSGEVEIAIQQLQEMIPIAGLEIVGPLPKELVKPLVFLAAPVTGTKDPDAARALIRFLRGPEAAAAIQAKGMETAPH